MTTIPVKAVDSDIKSGLKILSLGEPPCIARNERIPTSRIDAGGAQAVSQLLILEHVMESVSQDDRGLSRGVVKRPCEVFDVIGGAGSGG
jgi:hypothetical protein